MSPEALQLLETDRAFARMSEAEGAAEAFNAFLTDDALMLGDGAVPLCGREAIYEHMRRGTGTLLWSPQHAEVAVSGELGWTWGTFVYRPGGAGSTDDVKHGKYLNVWKRTPDGWRVAVDMGNSSPAEMPPS